MVEIGVPTQVWANLLAEGIIQIGCGGVVAKAGDDLIQLVIGLLLDANGTCSVKVTVWVVKKRHRWLIFNRRIDLTATNDRKALTISIINGQRVLNTQEAMTILNQILNDAFGQSVIDLFDNISTLKVNPSGVLSDIEEMLVYRNKLVDALTRGV